MKVIYGICSWGLGHATRSLPVLRRLIDDHHDMTVISSGRAQELLKRELNDKVKYVDIPDYPIFISENTQQFMAKIMIYWPVLIRKMQRGLQGLTKLLEKRKYDVIISDGRYDMYNKKIPSFFISHQMRIMNPLRWHWLENGSEVYNQFFFKRFREVIVPDYKQDDLSGDLAHNLARIDEDRIHYVGVLSDFNKIDTEKNVDYLISISGPEPQRGMLEEKLMAQLEQLDGDVVITLGKAEEKDVTKARHVTTYSFLNKDQREQLLNSSKIVITRSGYSTIMDLAVLGVKGLMIPTPGQIEQGYLAEYHNRKRTFYSVDQNHLELGRDVEIVKKTTGVTRTCDVERSVENIMDVIMMAAA